MFKASPVLSARLRLTTKQVNGGYYKGNRTGSMGSHTEYGHYIIDYRKTRHYKMPDLKNFELTPFVTKEMEPMKWEKRRSNGKTYKPSKVDGVDLLKTWKLEAPGEYDWMVDRQAEQAAEAAQTAEESVLEENFGLQEHELSEQPVRTHSASGKKPEQP